MQFLDPSDPDLQDKEDEEEEEDGVGAVNAAAGGDRQRLPVPRGPWDASADAGEISDQLGPRRYCSRLFGGGAFVLGVLGPVFCCLSVCMRARAVHRAHMRHAHI